MQVAEQRNLDQIDAAGFLRGLAIPGVTEWQDTPLGPPKTWTEGLRLAVQMMTEAPVPALITIKPCSLIYNAAFATLIGNLHPAAFGNASDVAHLPRRAGHDWRLAGRSFTVADFDLPGSPQAVLSILFPVQAAQPLEGKRQRELAEGPRADMLGMNYQPQIRLSDGKTIGFEALARWHHPEQGAIDPGYFIELAEKSDLILEIGDWVVSRALADITACHDCRLLRVAINVSPLQLRDPGFFAHVARSLAESGLPASCLELEITESVLIDREEGAARSFAALSELGVSLALDDFGTGYSNMTTLEHFSFDRLKLDRSFLRRFPRQRSQTLIQCAVEMAHRLGMEVVAEGIETEAQVEFLRNLGCDYAQGYLYAPPMPLNEAIAWKTAREV